MHFQSGRGPERVLALIVGIVTACACDEQTITVPAPAPSPGEAQGTRAGDGPSGNDGDRGSSGEPDSEPSEMESSDEPEESSPSSPPADTGGESGPERDGDALAVRLGDRAAGLLREASTVTVYRLARGPKSGQRDIAGRAIAEERRANARWARRYRDVLTSKRNLRWDTGKRCRFDPGLAVGFQNGAEELLVAMCFSCSDLTFIGQGAPEELVDFTRSRSSLLRLGRELFRDHPELEPVGPEDDPLVDPW